MIDATHGNTFSPLLKLANETQENDRPLLKGNINTLSNNSEKIFSNKKYLATAALTGITLLGTGVAALLCRSSTSSTGLATVAGSTNNPEKDLINNAMSYHPTWAPFDNMTGIEINVVTSKNETFSDNLVFEPHRVFAVAASFRDLVKAMLFTDYMTLKAKAGPEGIKSYFFHSIKFAISKGEKIATSFNDLIIKNARSRSFPPQDIDAMRKIIDRLTDEIQHLKGYQNDIGKRMSKKSDFGPQTARKWHKFFQSTFNKINEMINALLAFKH